MPLCALRATLLHLTVGLVAIGLVDHVAASALDAPSLKPGLTDTTGIVPSATIEYVNKVAQEAYQATGMELVILVHDDFEVISDAKDYVSFSDEVFAAWKREAPDRDDAVMVFIDAGKRDLQWEVGSKFAGWGRAYDIRSTLWLDMIKPLLADEIDTGLRGGTDALLENIIYRAADGLGPLRDQPLFQDTVVTLELDVIPTTAPTALTCLLDEGRGARQFWDARIDDEYDADAYLFTAWFGDGTSIEISVNPEFGDADIARDRATFYADALGRVPGVLRLGVERLGIHDGGAGAHAGAGKIFLYDELSQQRATDGRLEEMLFHEAVHAGLDRLHAQDPDWQDAQAKDTRFVTRYGQTYPLREDLADSALLVWALLERSDRLSEDLEGELTKSIPHRISYLTTLFEEQRKAMPQNVENPCS